MNEQQTMGDQSKSRVKTSRYVVQRAVHVGKDEAGATVFTAASHDTGVWEDIGEIEVAARTQRKTVIEKALRQFEIPDDSHPSLYRALNEDADEQIPVVYEPPAAPPPPPPVLRVGR